MPAGRCCASPSWLVAVQRWMPTMSSTRAPVAGSLRDQNARSGVHPPRCGCSASAAPHQAGVEPDQERVGEGGVGLGGDHRVLGQLPDAGQEPVRLPLGQVPPHGEVQAGAELRRGERLGQVQPGDRGQDRPCCRGLRHRRVEQAEHLRGDRREVVRPARRRVLWAVAEVVERSADHRRVVRRRSNPSTSRAQLGDDPLAVETPVVLPRPSRPSRIAMRTRGSGRPAVTASSTRRRSASSRSRRVGKRSGRARLGRQAGRSCRRVRQRRCRGGAARSPWRRAGRTAAARSRGTATSAGTGWRPPAVARGRTRPAPPAPSGRARAAAPATPPWTASRVATGRSGAVSSPAADPRSVVTTPQRRARPATAPAPGRQAAAAPQRPGGGQPGRQVAQPVAATPSAPACRSASPDSSSWSATPGARPRPATPRRRGSPLSAAPQVAVRVGTQASPWRGRPTTGRPAGSAGGCAARRGPRRWPGGSAGSVGRCRPGPARRARPSARRPARAGSDRPRDRWRLGRAGREPVASVRKSPPGPVRNPRSVGGDRTGGRVGDHASTSAPPVTASPGTSAGHRSVWRQRPRR